ncbi:MAG: TonB-dependent receptor [Chitinophagaceae bacterium]|nr:TonB-dependent receptor [Chitinophagaceae bacterium]
MFRICTLIFLLIVFGDKLFAQEFRVKGLVKTGNSPAEAASVQLSGKKFFFENTATDGTFIFDRIPSGSYTLTISFQGFVTVKKTVQVTGNSEIPEIKLIPQPELLQPVEVKALRASSLAPFSKTNISKNFIEKNNLGQDIPMLLNQTPGVVSFSDAGNGIGYTGLRIRGTDATRINMTINGIPYNDPESQGTFFVNLPDFMSSVSSIQVQRGVGTSTNGAGAFGASMNFSTHETPEETYLELNNSFGSFNTIKNTIKLGTALFDKKLTLDVRASNIKSDGYIDRASTSLQGAYISAGYHLPKSTIRFNAILGKEKTYQAWYGVSAADLKNNRTYNSAGTAKPGEPYEDEADNYRQNHYQLFYNTELSKKWLFNTAFYLTTGEGYYEQYRADENPADYALPGTEETDLVRQLWLKNKLFGQIFTLQYRNEKDEITWGGGWNHYPGRHFGRVIWTESNPSAQSTWYDNDASKTDVNTYVKWQRQLSPRWHLFTDLQFRHVNYEIEGFRNNPGISIDETWNFFNPKAGITYDYKNVTAYASYAMANKEPNRDDFEAGLTEKPRREQLHNVEIGIQRKEWIPGLLLGINGYLMYYRDQLVLTGKINDVGAYTRTNLPESYRIGTELEAKYQQKKWGFNYSLALSQNRAIDYTGYYDDYDNGGQIAVQYGNTPIALSPSVVQFFSIDWRPVKDGEVSLLNKYVGKQYLDNAGSESRTLDPFNASDLRLSYRLPLRTWVQKVQLVFQVNNIFNSLYEPNGYTFSYLSGNEFITENFFYPMAGTNMMAAINIRF